MTKQELAEFDKLFIETPVKKRVLPKKASPNLLESVSGWTIFKEIVRRYSTDLMIAGFWLELALIIYWKI